MKDKILEVLSQMDPFDDSQWTSDGAPLVDYVNSVMDETVTRQMIVDAAPKFSKSNPTLEEKIVVDFPEEQNEFQLWLSSASNGTLEQVEQDLNSQLGSIASEIEKLKNISIQTKLKIGMVRLKIRSLNPNNSDRDAIRSFIESQNQARADRVERKNKILQNISLKDIDPRSTLDIAMARKTSRGTNRPKFNA